MKYRCPLIILFTADQFKLVLPGLLNKFFGGGGPLGYPDENAW
jgi:hypothetical protein